MFQWPDERWTFFGLFNSVAEADRIYRWETGHDETLPTDVVVNNEFFAGRKIIGGQIVPPGRSPNRSMAAGGRNPAAGCQMGQQSFELIRAGDFWTKAPARLLAPPFRG